MSQDPQVSGLSPGQDLPAQHLVRRLWIPEFSCLKPSHMLFPWPRRLTLPCSPSSHPPVLQIQDSDRSLLPTLGHAVLPHLPPAFSSWNSLQGGQWIHFCAWDHTIPWRDMSPTKPRHCFAGCWMVGLSTLLGTQHPMRQVLPSLRSRPNSQVRERSNRFHNITRRHSVTSGLGQRHSSSPLMATEVVQEQDGPGRRPRVDMGQGENATKVNFQTELKSWFRILGGTSGETLRTIAYDWSSLIQVTELTKKKKKKSSGLLLPRPLSVICSLDGFWQRSLTFGQKMRWHSFPEAPVLSSQTCFSLIPQADHCPSGKHGELPC